MNKSKLDLAKEYLAEQISEELVEIKEALNLTDDQLKSRALEIINRLPTEKLEEFIENFESSENLSERINSADSYTEVDQLYKLYEAVQDATLVSGERACPQCLYEILADASCGCPHLIPEGLYKGRKITLNKPYRQKNHPNKYKYKVFVEDPKTGQVTKVFFGSPRVFESSKKRSKPFRIKHSCKNSSTKKFWSCRSWLENI